MAKSNVTNYFVGLVLIIVGIQVTSWIINQYNPEIEVLKLGWGLLLLTAVSAIISLFIMGKRLGSLNKQDIIFIIAEVGGVVAVFYFLPQYVPQIFSSIIP